MKDLGLDTNSADMCYYGNSLITTPYQAMVAQFIGDSAMKGEVRTEEDFDLTPAWSIGALDALVPRTIKIDFSNYYSLTIKWENCFYVRYSSMINGIFIP